MKYYLLFPGTLALHVTGDKGGSSTKLLVQILNSTKQHSVKSSKLLAFFEGCPDDRYVRLKEHTSLPFT